MRRQIEGSRAVAETVALCRPEVVCAYPISPQTHIIEAIGAMVKSGDLAPCEFINVESEFAAMSVSIGASATGARAYTATASQGLLFMIEAVYNAAGLGLPDRDDARQPGDRCADQHLERPQRRHGRARLRLDPALRRDEPGGGRPAHPGLPPRRRALPPGHGVHGRLHPHPRGRGRRRARTGDVDAFLPPYEPRQVLDPHDPISIGAMVGPKPSRRSATSHTSASSTRWSASPPWHANSPTPSGATAAGSSTSYRTEDAETIVVALGSVLGTIKDAVDAAPRQPASASASSGSHRSDPSLTTPCVTPCPAPDRVVVVEKAFSVGFGGVLSTDVAMATHDADLSLRTVVAGLGGRAITQRSLEGMLADATSERLERLTFLDLDHQIIERERARIAGIAALGSIGGEHSSRPRHRRLPDRLRRPNDHPARALLPSRQLRRRQPPGRRGGSDAFSPTLDRSNSLDSGHRACQGCGEALGARYALDAAMRATNGQLIAVNATGCLEVFSTPYPETSWRVAWLHSLFGNAPAVATGVAAALKVKGKHDVRVVGQAGDGGTVDIGFGCLSGMFERNDDVLFICYDNEAYMNTGVQRSGATPPAARTATTEALGPEPGNVFGQGKDLPRLAMAHGIPYVATATVADLHDLEAKVERAMEFHGARYLHILVPCPLGWGSAPSDTIRVARLAHETGLFPVFEAEHGEVTAVSRDPPPHARRGLPVDPESLRPPLRRTRAAGHRGPHPGDRRSQHRHLWAPRGATKR